MAQQFNRERMWHTRDLKPSYDVVIVGAGVHGLATAYYLGSRHGIRRGALLEKGYLGSGNSGRNTAIIRSNYRTPEGIPFYQASVKLYQELSRELGWNMLFSQCGHLTLGHTDSAVNGLRVRAENNQGRMGLEHLEDGRRPTENREPPAAGVCHRAVEAVSRQGDRFRHPPRVRQPDRQRRIGDRCRN